MTSTARGSVSLWTAAAVSLLALGGVSVLAAVPATYAIAACAVNVVVFNQNDIPISGATVTIGTSTATTGPSGTVNSIVTCGTVSVSVSASGCTPSPFTGSVTVSTGTVGDKVQLVCSPAVSPPSQTGTRLQLLSCPPSITFPPSTPFFIQQGWGYPAWSSGAAAADITDAEAAGTNFELSVDGVLQTSTGYFSYNPTSDTLGKNFLTNFPAGMTGTHVFKLAWNDQNVPSRDITCSVTVTFATSVPTPQFPLGFALLFALLVPALLAMRKRTLLFRGVSV